MSDFAKLFGPAALKVVTGKDCIADEGTSCDCHACKAHEAKMHAEWIALGKPGAPEVDDSDEIEVCEGCMEPTRFVGEDGLSYCDSCEHIVEGATKIITENEYEKLHA
jgi:hypothetical protein